jgi:hypothetical protein
MATSNESTAQGPSADDAPLWRPNPESSEPSDEAGPSAPHAEALHSSAPHAEAASRTSATNAAKRPGVKRAGSTSMLLVVAALVAIGGIGFAVGHSTGGSSSGGNTQGGNGIQGGAPNASGFPGGGPNASGRPDGAGLNGVGGAASLSGMVVSSTADSITIQTSDGQQVTIGTGTATTYHNQTAATSSSVAVGATVTVKTASGGTSADASASPGTTGTRTATDITVSGN